MSFAYHDGGPIRQPYGASQSQHSGQQGQYNSQQHQNMGTSPPVSSGNSMYGSVPSSTLRPSGSYASHSAQRPSAMDPAAGVSRMSSVSSVASGQQRYQGQHQQQHHSPQYPTHDHAGHSIAPGPGASAGSGGPSRTDTVSSQRRPGPPPCPPNVNPEHWRWFHLVDTDRSGQISASELQGALRNGDHSQFSTETVKMLLGMFDTDRSGQIGFNEFVDIFQYVEQWQGIFRRFDADRSGTIDGDELARALAEFQYNLSAKLVDLLCRKYSSVSTVPGRPAGITFDSFVRCCVSVKTLTSAFMELDTDRDGWVNISYDKFLEIILSSP